jgi:hypothetical protein
MTAKGFADYLIKPLVVGKFLDIVDYSLQDRTKRKHQLETVTS